ncbi:MAG: hypothetical protein HQL94_04730 [Magnetococcales bacterium]|nr:hypothetical protein [Magnetococcales bacterium]
MHAITFDTLEFTEQLRAVGISDEHAKGHVKALVTVMKQTEDRIDERIDRRDKQSEEQMSGLVTRQDLKETKDELKRDIKDLDSKIEMNKIEFKRDIKELEYRMTIQVGLMLVAVAGMLFTALRYFPPTQPIVISNHPLPALEQNLGKVPATTRPATPQTTP